MSMLGAAGTGLATADAAGVIGRCAAGDMGWRAAGDVAGRAAEVALLPIFAAILS